MAHGFTYDACYKILAQHHSTANAHVNKVIYIKLPNNAFSL